MSFPLHTVMLGIGITWALVAQDFVQELSQPSVEFSPAQTIVLQPGELHNEAIITERPTSVTCPCPALHMAWTCN